MSSPTTVNSHNLNKKTLLNIISGTEVDNLAGTTVLEKYMLMNKLDDPSGEAVLYRANAPAQNISVVVKIYRRAEAVKPEVLQKLTQLNSPYIVRIIDHGLYQSYPCVVMPYFRNGSLKGKTLHYSTIKDTVIPEVTAGLKYLHDNGIIHKDIKPANLMLSDDGKHIHIIDFGISSARDENLSILITRTGMSPEYSAPETFNNVWVKESDFYSFGITLYELFRGCTPFQNSDSREELAASASLHKIPFSEEFPKELVTLIRGLTYRDLSNRNDANNPNRRWTDKEIERWLKGENLPIPGEADTGETAPDSDKSPQEERTEKIIFSSPYDFKDSGGRIVNLRNLQEFTEAFGTNWKEGKKHIGRGYVSEFFHEQKIRSALSIVKDCEEAGVTDEAYSKMLTDLGALVDYQYFFWNSVRIDDKRKLSDGLTDSMFKAISNLETEYNDVFQAISYWYEINNKTDELAIIRKMQQMAEANNSNTRAKVAVFCSFLNPDMQIKIGDTVYQNIADLKQYAETLKTQQPLQYFVWLEQNIDDIRTYTSCVEEHITQTLNNLNKDFLQEQTRKREQQIRDEQARREREEQLQREEQRRKEEQAEREREEQFQREVQASREREEQHRKVERSRVVINVNVIGYLKRCMLDSLGSLINIGIIVIMFLVLLLYIKHLDG